MTLPGTWCLFVLLTTALFSQCWAHSNCENESACDGETGAVCALNKEDVCFNYFPTKCHMRISECENEREYVLYKLDYCRLEGFMCSALKKSYSSYLAKHEDLDKIIYSIYSPQNP